MAPRSLPDSRFHIDFVVVFGFFKFFMTKHTMDIFEKHTLVKVCSPMVRYSRLPFRLLVREYGCDLAFTPMLMADSFIKSDNYRKVESVTCEKDNPLVVQFAANTPEIFAEATELAYQDCIGVDLNCGCPQSWASHEGIGACMMNKPDLISDILRQTRNRISDSTFGVSCKIRIFLDMARTVDLARQLEATGISFLTVHGRTKAERNEPVHLDYIKAIVDAVDIPVIANGDIDSLEKAHAVQEVTGAKGVMSARSILENPALFTGQVKTPVDCINKWCEINTRLDTHFTMFHRHLIHMCAPLLNKFERRIFNNLTDKKAVLDFISDKFNNHSNLEEEESVVVS
ncbi:tRNA-dihydrouridine(20a/20b) synthase [NAD(P)+]-like isoform X1 [Folsomia candida]|uniref:tRNA-dihydrouridine(20a/20b) synthase [NAD(P)+]-like isoform X1 n=1 Tax=Folsomia candida TaxID=158441 RepID=UPI000B902A6B|nr:tRNA-dihydrouridine(20a/20b) synthase [NAD(P)+]-like isoform X1 [Folsomia candida]